MGTIWSDTICKTPFISVVVVTYGDRWHLVSKVLLFAETVAAINVVVVVDNGTKIPIAEQVKQAGFVKSFVVRVPNNLGSAHGFKLGIETALGRGAEYIWLLDDDNLPKPDALDALLEANEKLKVTIPLDEFALLSFRPHQQADIASGVPLRRCYPKPGSFFGFHLLDVPYKFWRRTIWGKPIPPESFPELVPIPTAPYSGFFFHCSVIDRIGLPNLDMVLYSDDTELTSRLPRTGGHIFLIPHSRIDDLEASWNSKSRFNSTFLGWLCGSGELRAYYGARNQAYLEAKIGGYKIIRFINRGLYIGALTVVALIKGRVPRLKLLLDAIRQGEAGMLGLNKRFPLP
jgi:GT2 family glycosyltransferase